MNGKPLRSALLAASVALTAAAPVAAETLMLVNSDAIGSITDRMNEHFAADLEERSGGEIEVNYIAGESLGSAPQVTDQMIAGSVEAFGNVLAWFAPLDADFQILTWGFTFRDTGHMQAFLNSDRFAEISQRVLDNHGVRILAAAPSQPRILFSTRPVTTAEDLVGLQMRVPQIEAYLELWTALETRPTQVPWGEVYLGLTTGVVEAAEGPPSGAFSQRFHEAAQHITLTNHLLSTVSFSINEALFQRYTEEQQQWIIESAQASVEWAFQQSQDETQGVLDEMVASGATLYDIDIAPLQDKAMAAVERLEAEGLWSAGLFAEIQAIE